MRQANSTVFSNELRETTNQLVNIRSKSNMTHVCSTPTAQTVSELEAMLCSQNGLMEKLTAECHLLTGKLDDASHRHK